MPRISSFYGITVLMFFGDHNPPHFHARYSGQVARIALDGTVLDGQLPRRALQLVRDWTGLHHDELAACWERAVKNEPPGTIDPLPWEAPWSTSRRLRSSRIGLFGSNSLMDPNAWLTSHRSCGDPRSRASQRMTNCFGRYGLMTRSARSAGQMVPIWTLTCCTATSTRLPDTLARPHRQTPTRLSQTSTTARANQDETEQLPGVV